MHRHAVTDTDPAALVVSAPRRFAAWHELTSGERARYGWLALTVGISTILFGQPLIDLVSHAARHDLHSHIPLIPVIAAYLLYTRWRRPAPLCTSITPATLLGSLAMAALYAAAMLRATLSINDYLALTTFAYLCVVMASGLLFVGSSWMAGAAFPIGFLLFMIPLPDAAVYWLERGLVLASADAAAWFLAMTGMPLLRDGTVLGIPGITLEVAQECSGIRSSWVLFITSALASRMFLNSAWRRLVLVALVIPLGIIRNGLRILVIGLLSVHVGPHMIGSPIHHRGGPIFFALSLIPLFLLLRYLRRGELRRRTME
jgi:exosortase C (VPDSG-CTERM-specific)